MTNRYRHYSDHAREEFILTLQERGIAFKEKGLEIETEQEADSLAADLGLIRLKEKKR